MSGQKETVLKEIESTWQALQDALASVPLERMEVSSVVESWSAKDLIGHITTWENEAMKSLQNYFKQNDVTMLAWPPDLDAFNARTTEEKRARSLDDLLNDMKTTHDKTVRFIQAMKEEAFDVPEVEARIRIDAFAHYADHTEGILKWLEGALPD